MQAARDSCRGVGEKAGETAAADTRASRDRRDLLSSTSAQPKEIGKNRMQLFREVAAFLDEPNPLVLN